MGSDYQRFDAPHLDYALWECPFDQAVTLRGPAVDRTRPYVVCLGAAPTFGRFCRDPYPALLAGHLGIQVLNAGVAGAGPSTFLGGGWSAWLDGAEAVVVQVLAARSESNSLYDSLPEQAALGVRRSDGQTMRFEAFLGDLLETADPETVRRIVQETRTNYVDNMIRLLDAIRVPKILLWLSKRPARYDIDVGRLHGILNSHPQLVDQAMLDRIRPRADAFVECVSAEGIPQRLWPADSPLPGADLREGGLFNRYYPSPEMHVLAAARLADACRSAIPRGGSGQGRQSPLGFFPGLIHPLNQGPTVHAPRDAHGRSPSRATDVGGPARKPGRIVFLTSCPLLWGGSEELWSGAALELRRRGFQVRAARSRPWPWSGLHPRWERLRKAGIALGGFRVRMLEEAVPDAVIRFLPRFAGPAFHARNLWLALKLRFCRADLAVISQGGAYDGISSVNLPDICRAAGVPYVLVCQKASETEWPHDGMQRVYAKAFDGASLVCFVSEHNRRITSQQLAKTIDRAEVVRNPTLVTTVDPLPWPAPADGRFRLACVGRMWPMEKGQDVLLNVLARDRWRDRPLDVDFYGEGPMERGLQAMARYLGLSNVRFHGQVPDITAVWRDHHALLLPSRAEGLALAQVEAMRCGRPPIVADAGGARELIDDGIEGFVAGAATADEVDAALERAWVRRHEWEAIGRRAAERVARDVPADPCVAFADRLEQLHASVVRRVSRD